MAYSTDITNRNTNTALVPAPSSDDPDVIRQQIDHTRAQLGSTIQEIADRLSPENLIEQAKSTAKEATVGRFKEMTHEANRKVEGMSSSFSQTVRDNPLPFAVIGLGLGWLFLSERNNKQHNYRADDYPYRMNSQRYYGDRYYDMDDEGMIDAARERVGDMASTVERRANRMKNRVSGAVHDAGESVSEMAGRAEDAISETGERIGERISETASRARGAVNEAAHRVGETTDNVQERAGELTERARMEADRLRRQAEWRSRQAAQRTKQSFMENMDENPLAVGAVLAIAGAAIGAAIPASEYENKLMGQTRDRLLDEAKVRAQDVVERVQTVVEDTQHAVMTEAKDAARRQNLTLDNGEDGRGSGNSSGNF